MDLLNKSGPHAWPKYNLLIFQGVLLTGVFAKCFRKVEKVSFKIYIVEVFYEREFRKF